MARSVPKRRHPLSPKTLGRAKTKLGLDREKLAGTLAGNVIDRVSLRAQSRRN